MATRAESPPAQTLPVDAPHVAVAWACGLASVVVYGLTPTVAALSYDTGLTPTVLVALRSLCGAILILAFAGATGRIRRVPVRAALGLMLVCGPLFGLQVICYFAAVQSTGAQVSVVVVHVYPVFVLFFVWLTTRQRQNPAVIVLCLVMIGGIGLVGGSGGAAVTPAGVGLAVTSAVGYALYLVLGERWVRHVGAVLSSGLVTVGAAATAGLVAAGLVAAVTAQPASFTAAGWVSVIAQGAFMIPIGVGCAFYAVRRLGSVSLSLLGLLEPVVGVLAARVVLGERLQPVQWAGMLVILAVCAILPRVSAARKVPVGTDVAAD
ncbi:DMT family transporter [Prescottella subtropica]|uniref:DMT family transporter n=1 Tax=Prescottella subtropica TaxID=2545757 RepID=UPI0010F8769D|nr:DMT family transporter [Prescottella subtropica]